MDRSRVQRGFVGFFPVYFLSFLAFALHTFLNSRMSYCTDELYFIDCSKHLDFGYFDITPLVPTFIRIARSLFGESLTALRFFPAVGHAITILLTGFITHELGGRRFAKTLACLCVFIAPAFLRIGSVFVIPSLEPVMWTLSFYLVLLTIKYDRPKQWIWVGLAAGFGFMIKPSMLLFGAGLTVGLLLTPLRVYFLNRWIWLGGCAAFAVMLPNLVWQTRHEWITFEFVQAVKNASWVKNINLGDFLVGQVLYLHPLNALVWISGILYFFVHPSAKQYRVFGWIYLVVITLLVSQAGKLYYLLPIYPMFLAAGSVAFEKKIQSYDFKWLQSSVLVLFATAGILMAPAGLPVFSMEQFDRFARSLTMGLISAEKIPEVFEAYREMEGSERTLMLQEVAALYRSLPVKERENTSILASERAEAGAIDLLGPKYGLPQSISGNVNYYIWGPRGQTGDTTITIGMNTEFLKKVFRQVVDVPGKSKLNLCRGPFVPLYQNWKLFKSFPGR